MICKNGKLFGKINLFDLLVILLVVVLVFGIGYKLLVLNKAEEQNSVEITYNLRIKSVRDVTVNSFRNGDMVYHYKLEEPIGIIENVTATEATDIMETLEGTLVSAPIEGRFDVSVTVKGTAIRQDDGNLMMGKVKIVEGTEFRASTQLANCTATIENVQCK